MSPQTAPIATATTIAAEQQFRMSFYEPAEATRPVTRIAELPESEQPAYRALHYGPGALSTIELLALACSFSDLELPQRLLAETNGLPGLLRAPLSDLVQFRGIGDKRACQLKAILELGRRAMTASPAERLQVKSPADAAGYMMLEMAGLEQEELRVMILSSKNHIIRTVTVYRGSVNTAVMRIGELFREAIRVNGVAAIVFHNHPSGDPTPSAEDVAVTRQIADAGKLLGVELLDHLIIGEQRFVSLKERGLGF